MTHQAIPNRISATQRGFTLIELTIVLAIIGLLAGGTLAGKSLIRSAEVRGVMVQANSILAAIEDFQDQYEGIPGDFDRATTFWGSAGGTGSIYDAACYNAQTATSKATCNGNGNRSPDNYNEAWIVWKHLANAGMIEGNYTGRSADGINTFAAIAGTNMPKGRVKNSHFFFKQDATNADPTLWFPETNVFEDVLQLNGEATVDNYGVLTPKEVWQLDLKFDDGSPVYGRVYNLKKTAPAGTNCTTSDSAATAEYDVTNPNRVCVFVIRR